MRFLAGLLNLFVYGLFASILLVMAIFWWHGRDLPSTAELAEYEPATLSRVYAADGSLMAEFARERRLFTPIDEIPPLIKNAFVSAEDKNFYSHSGVDGVGLAKAMVDNIRRSFSGQRMRGASTITMQVVKNFLLSGDRALTRKIKELLLAQRLETALTKEQILELYLNEIFLGSNAYGVTSAADRYFDKRLEDVTIEEAAYLAALPKAPSNLHPVRHKEYATDRRNYVLAEMRDNGFIDQQQFEEASAKPLATVFDKPAEDGGRIVTSIGIDYFAEEIRRDLVEERGFEAVHGGGLAIRATMEPEMQVAARAVLQQKLWEFTRDRGYAGPIARLEDLDLEADPLGETGWRTRLTGLELPRDLIGWRRAVVLLVGQRSAEIGIEGVESEEPIYLPFSDVKDWARQRTGVDENGDAVLGPELTTPADLWEVGDVLFVAKPEGSETWSMRATPEVNGALVALDPRTGRVLAMQGGFSHDLNQFNRATQAKRQPGSAFKPFVFAAALEHGYDPNSVVLDAPISLEQPDGSIWRPRNYSGRFYGAVPLRWGMEKSHNLMTVRVAMDVGLETVAGYAELFGVYKDMPPLVSYALGAGETSLLKLATSYAMFVNGGKRIEPSFIDRIQDRRGETIFRHDHRICPECRAPEYLGQEQPYVPEEGEQVINPITAYQIVSFLEGVTVRGTATKVGKAFDFPVAGKTGTTNQARDAWFIGFTNDLVIGCFVGFDTPTPLGTKMSGGKVCGPIFTEFLTKAAKTRAPGPFRLPSEAVLVKIDRNSGCVVPDDREGADFIWEPFHPETAPYVGECPSGGIDGQTTTSRDAARIPQENAIIGDAVGPGAPLNGLSALDPQIRRPAAPTRTQTTLTRPTDSAQPPRITQSANPATRGLDAALRRDLESLGLGGAAGAQGGPGPNRPQPPRQPDALIGGGSGGLY
ncbi:MAG: PBP1A family penicillin-binding protein [Pseudomonadota bacterium]